MTVTSIQVAPTNQAIPRLGLQQYTATATFNNGQQQNFTNQVTWSTGNAAIANITANGLAQGQTPGTTTVTANFSGVTGSTNITVNPPTLQSFSVTPANLQVAQGATQGFTVTGLFSDNTQQNLTGNATFTTAAGAGTFAGNTLTATGLGTFPVNATINGTTVSTNVTLVQPAALRNLLFTGHAGSIRGFSVNPNTGEIAALPNYPVTLNTTLNNPVSRLEPDPNRRRVFASALIPGAVNTTAVEFIDAGEAGNATSIGATTGINTQTPDIAVVAGGSRFVFTGGNAGSGGNQVRALTINPDGTVAFPPQVVTNSEAVRALTGAETANYIFVAGPARIQTYLLNATNTFQATSNVTANFTRIETDRGGRFLFGINGTQNIASAVVGAGNGSVGAFQNVAPAAVPVTVRPSQDGRFVAVLSANSLAIHPVNQTTGAIGAAVATQAVGPNAIDVDFDFNGNFVYVGEAGGTIRAFGFNQFTGALTVVNGSPFNAGAAGLASIRSIR